MPAAWRTTMFGAFLTRWWSATAGPSSATSSSPAVAALTRPPPSSPRNTIRSSRASSPHQLPSRTSVTVRFARSNPPSLNGPAVTGIAFSQALLNASGLLLVELGYSGVNSERHSENGVAKVIFTSWSFSPRSTFSMSA